jgi:hypothetical protein
MADEKMTPAKEEHGRGRGGEADHIETGMHRRPKK